MQQQITYIKANDIDRELAESPSPSGILGAIAHPSWRINHIIKAHRVTAMADKDKDN